jgi:small subunit ribosomal protein S13
VSSAPKTAKDDAPSEPAKAAEAGPSEKAPKKDGGGRSKDAAKEPKDSKDEGKEGGKGKPGKAGKAGAPGTGKDTKKKFVPDNPNFRYIVRLAGSDLDGTRATALAITGVRGVGPRISEVACRLAGVSLTERIGNLPEAAVDGLEQVLGDLPAKLPIWMVNHPVDPVTGETHHFFGADLETARRDDINRMKMIRSYRGVRHERGQKVRGQRTRSNGRTGMAAGVLKKAAKEAAAASGKETTTAAPAAPAAAAPAGKADAKAAPAAEKKA